MYSLITLVLSFTIIILYVKNKRLRNNGGYLNQKLEETASLLDILEEGIIECDQNMVPVRINKAAIKILNIEASSIINMVIDKNNPSNEKEKLLSQVLFPPKDIIGNKYEIDLAGPNFRKLRVTSIPKTNHENKLLGYVKVIIKINEKNPDNHISAFTDNQINV